MSLTRQLNDRASPISLYLRARFPHTRDLQRRYREPIAQTAPLAPVDRAPVAFPTVGGAFDWRLRFLLTPQPDLHLALAGAVRLSETPRRLAMELRGTLGGQAWLGRGPGRHDPDPPMAADAPGPAGLEEDRLVRCCYALALYTEVFRAGLMPGSRLLTLPRDATLEDLLGLASEAEVADLRALTVEARRVLLPALTARGGPLHVGPTFIGSPDVGGADGDVIVGGLLVEWKATRGDRRHSDGRRYCSLDLLTIQQLLGYLLLDYQDEYAIDTLALYSARYAYLVTWPVVELLAELAGGPVDLAELRIGFQEAAKRSMSTKSLSNRDRQPHGRVRRRRAMRPDP